MVTYKGEDIKQLIPQRFPFMMVEEFENGKHHDKGHEEDENSATTRLTVGTANYFLLPNGEMAETGIIEHLAQSCSALAGYKACQSGATTPPVGMIAEVKHFTCHRRPKVEELIESSVSFGFSFGSMTLAQGVSYIDDELYVDYTVGSDSEVEAYQVVSTDESGDLIVKLVNVTDTPRTFAIAVDTASPLADTADVAQLKGDSLNNDNILGQPEVCKIENFSITGIRDAFNYTVPQYSVTVLRLHR